MAFKRHIFNLKNDLNTNKRKYMCMFGIFSMQSLIIISLLTSENIRSHIFVLNNVDTVVTTSSINRLTTLGRPLLASPVRGGKNIYFIESSCLLGTQNGNKRFKLNERQVCSIESAITSNPNATLYLLYTCPLSPDILGTVSEYVYTLFTYSNFHIFVVNGIDYFTGTPLDEWFRSGALADSTHPVEHASDVLRLLTVWKFGGVYLDLDYIIRKSFNTLPPNFIGFEGEVLNLGNSVFGFDSGQTGRRVLDMSLEEIRTNFDGNAWSHNGPELLTRVMKQVCNRSNIKGATTSDCKGVSLLTSSYFYPIPYEDFEHLITEKFRNKTMDLFHSSYGVHTWNNLSSKKKINLKLRSPYVLLVKEFCPTLHKFFSVSM